MLSNSADNWKGIVCWKVWKTFYEIFNDHPRQLFFTKYFKGMVRINVNKNNSFTISKSYRIWFYSLHFSKTYHRLKSNFMWCWSLKNSKLTLASSLQSQKHGWNAKKEKNTSYICCIVLKNWQLIFIINFSDA